MLHPLDVKSTKADIKRIGCCAQLLYKPIFPVSEFDVSAAYDEYFFRHPLYGRSTIVEKNNDNNRTRLCVRLACRNPRNLPAGLSGCQGPRTIPCSCLLTSHVKPANISGTSLCAKYPVATLNICLFYDSRAPFNDKHFVLISKSSLLRARLRRLRGVATRTPSPFFKSMPPPDLASLQKCLTSLSV